MYQNQANKEWNHSLASAILREDGESFKQKAQELEEKSQKADLKSEEYLEKTGHLANAGTFLEIAIALSSISLLLGRKFLWQFALALSLVGMYFLVVGLLF